MSKANACRETFVTKAQKLNWICLFIKFVLVSNKRCKVLWWIYFIHELKIVSFFLLQLFKAPFCTEISMWSMHDIFCVCLWDIKKGFVGLIGPSILLLMFSCLPSDNSCREQKTLVHSQSCYLSFCVKSKIASETILRFIAFSIYAVSKKQNSSVNSFYFWWFEILFLPWQLRLSSQSSFLFCDWNSTLERERSSMTSI